MKKRSEIHFDHVTRSTCCISFKTVVLIALRTNPSGFQFISLKGETVAKNLHMSYAILYFSCHFTSVLFAFHFASVYTFLNEKDILSSF